MRRIVNKRLVVIESPLAGDVEKNLAYAKACLLDSLRRHEAPFASHLLYAQDGTLDDNDPEQRELGLEAGFAWGDVADVVAVYVDLGVSSGMQRGIKRAQQLGQPVEYRRILGGSDGAEKQA